MSFYYKPLNKIFVAGTYRTDILEQMANQYEIIADHVYNLTNTGEYCVLCPIVMYHDTYLQYGSKPHDFWLNINLSLLDSTVKEVHVIVNGRHDLTLSKIIDHAKEQQIEIKYFYV